MENQTLVENIHKMMSENCVKEEMTHDVFKQFNEEFQYNLMLFSSIINDYLKPHSNNISVYMVDYPNGIKKGSWNLSIQWKPNSRTINKWFDNSNGLLNHLLDLLRKRKPKMYRKFKHDINSCS